MRLKLSNVIDISVHKEGRIFVFPFLLLFLASFLYSGISTISLVFFIFTIFFTFFFRDPNRITPEIKDVVFAPSDGKILNIEIVKIPEYISNDNNDYYKVSIFLNIDDVHIQRAPMQSVVINKKYVSGKFLNASLDKASIHNERNYVLFKNEFQENILCIQIAGFIARRIVSLAEIDTSFEAGERYGIIKFGSRVELYFPKNYSINVLIGQTLIAGETVIAKRN